MRTDWTSFKLITYIFTAILGFELNEVTYPEDNVTHEELISLVLSGPGSQTIVVTFTVYPRIYTDLVSQAILFVPGTTRQVIYYEPP